MERVPKRVKLLFKRSRLIQSGYGTFSDLAVQSNVLMLGQIVVDVY